MTLGPGRFVNLRNEGNCCWNVYSQPNFNQESKKIVLGFSGRINFVPQSAEKTQC
jgi:hypothetical protein